MMTKKDYEPIAAILRQAASKPVESQRHYIISSLAQLFQNDNPRFNEDNFLNASDFISS